MDTLRAASSPSSFQLRLGFRCKKSASLIHLRMNFRPSARRIWSLSASAGRATSAGSATARDGSESAGDRTRSGNSWMSSGSEADSFSGWLDKDSGDSERNRGFQGMVGAGLAGIFLAAGVTFASLALSKRSSGLRKQMEPLTTQQEVLLASDDLNDIDNQVGNERNTVSTDDGRKQNDRGSEFKTALQVPPGKVLVPAVVDQVQGQALSALQVLKVIEADVKPGDLCTRREYARWLVTASSVLSRSTTSKIYPAMYIENVTELAFDDVSPEDPDFPSIQGLAEAGLISSKLSRRDLHESLDRGPVLFSSESPLSRQDLISWKMVERKQLPEVDKKILSQCSGFIDVDKINADAWPAIVADLSSGDQSIIALAFGFTRLFQPDKPVTKAQAAIALVTCDAAELVSEELARIEAESMAEAAVAAHTDLVAQVEKDLSASFEKELAAEKEKIDSLEKLAAEAKLELERLRAERNEENNALIQGRAAVESEMEILTRLRHEVEEQLQSLTSDKMEIAFERDRINKLRQESESENQAIAKLQHDLEVERKALSMARAWAEDEARRVREHAKALEEARNRWEMHGIKVVVDDDLRDDATAGVTWLNGGKESPMDETTVNRAENLVKKLKVMAGEIKGKSSTVIEKIIQRIKDVILVLKQKAAEVARDAEEFRRTVALKVSSSMVEFQQNAAGFSSNVKDGARRLAEDCRDGVEKITQKFKT